MRKRWAFGVAAIGVFVLAGWLVLSRHENDPYPFLAGHRPVDVSVLPPGTWEPRELRVYTWKQPWQTVETAARNDLPAFKLVEHRRRNKQGPGATWMSKATYGNGLEGTSADVVLEILPGRIQYFDAKEPDVVDDPNWVTVAVTTTLDDNWINIVRYTCFGWRD